jgi:methionine-gamma-lyase
MHIETLCAGELQRPANNPPHVLPIYASSSFVFDDALSSVEAFTGQKPAYTYGRYGNPTIDVVAQKIALLESSPDTPAQALLTASGQAAVSTLCMALLRAGDKILTQADLYGGTTELFNHVLAPLGIETTVADLNDAEALAHIVAHDPKIKMVYVETPANPTLRCVDIRSLAALAKSHNLILVADNTFATPYHTQPLVLGAHYAIHSTTKYLNGHGNSIGGAIVGHLNDTQWQQIWRVLKLAGGTAGPMEAWLTHNGLKTFALRMRTQSSNAHTIAAMLAQHPHVHQVNYPGLSTHSTHHIAGRQMHHGFGAMLSFEPVGGYQAALDFLNNVRICTIAPTLGDLDTLVLHPASSSHLHVPPAQRLANGITDGLVRISVGIEHIDDLLDDISRALEGVG